MNKIHQTPEFQVIKQNEVNTKFFTASKEVPGTGKETNVVSIYKAGSWS